VDLSAALQRHFGFDEFRPGQREACEAALAGRDALVVMPTGAGKSLCYQLPALLRADLTIVVSPLLSLMQDQVDALIARGAGTSVGVINSQQDGAANEVALARALAGELRLLYVAPERFASPGFAERIADAAIGLFVVDEAHCVSQWGHDFRPDYFRLADVALRLGASAVMASTATATPRVAADIVKRLALREPVRIATGFDRPNLSFTVLRPAPHEKLPRVLQALGERDALPALVYTGTRAGAAELAAQISEQLGEEAVAYHAGLERELRARVQRSFLADETAIVVATNAFGMGVDKPNIRTVVHATVPSSVEGYYQEAGRAGRDGAPSRAILVAEPRDKALHVHFIKRDELDERLPQQLAASLAEEADVAGRYSVATAAVARSLGCGSDQLRALIGHLVGAGVVEPAPSAPDRLAGRMVREFDARARGLCRASIGEGARARWRQYREIWAYVEGSGCRRRAILRHFGDRPRPLDARTSGSPTGNARGPATGDALGPETGDPHHCCDVCVPALVSELPAADPVALDGLDEAIFSIASVARPAVGRTTCAEILHGARTKKIERNSYNGLAAYATSSHLARAQILARIDELIAERRLATSGGPYPVLRVPSPSIAA